MQICQWCSLGTRDLFGAQEAWVVHRGWIGLLYLNCRIFWTLSFHIVSYLSVQVHLPGLSVPVFVKDICCPRYIYLDSWNGDDISKIQDLDAWHFFFLCLQNTNTKVWGFWSYMTWNSLCRFLALLAVVDDTFQYCGPWSCSDFCDGDPFPHRLLREVQYDF